MRRARARRKGAGRPWLAAAVLSLSAACSAATGAADGGACAPGDTDGLSGGDSAFDLVVDDTGFSPTILKAQNRSTVKVTLKNSGTRPHGFVVACLATPNITGCPTESCFPDASVIEPIPPDASATATFVAPNPEGAYAFGSGAKGDTMAGQFILQ
jgi:hypothetical protein